MNGLDWLDDSSEEWPEGWGDVAKGVLMPHTAALSLAGKVLDRGRGGPQRRVVTHTQPPPVAQSAREVQGQLTGLLRTVKGVEEKLDDMTQRLALIQRASAGSHEADLFRQSLSTAVLAAAPAFEAGDLFAAGAHVVPVLQNLKGARISVAAAPVSTFAFPLAALAVFAARVPRKPDIIAPTLKASNNAPARVSIVSPDGGKIRFVLGTGDVTRDSDEYEGPIVVNGPGTLRARVFGLVRASKIAEVVFT